MRLDAVAPACACRQFPRPGRSRAVSASAPRRPRGQAAGRDRSPPDPAPPGPPGPVAPGPASPVDRDAPRRLPRPRRRPVVRPSAWPRSSPFGLTGGSPGGLRSGRHRRLACLAQDRLRLGDGSRADLTRHLRQRQAVEPVQLVELVGMLVALDRLVEQVQADLVAGEGPLEGEEAPPMEWREAEPADRVAVLAGGVALVALPAVAGVP